MSAWEHDRSWHKETRASMRGTYDAIWQDGFWKGIGLGLSRRALAPRVGTLGARLILLGQAVGFTPWGT